MLATGWLYESEQKGSSGDKIIEQDASFDVLEPLHRDALARQIQKYGKTPIRHVEPEQAFMWRHAATHSADRKGGHLAFFRTWIGFIMAWALFIPLFYQAYKRQKLERLPAATTYKGWQAMWKAMHVHAKQRILAESSQNTSDDATQQSHVTLDFESAEKLHLDVVAPANTRPSDRMK